VGILTRDLSDEEYQRLNWLSLIEGTEWERYRWNAAQELLKRGRELFDAGDTVVGEALQILGGAISMQLLYGAPRPFGAMVQMREGRSLSIEDLDEHDARLLGRIARDTADPWLRARFGDLAVSIDDGLRKDWELGKLSVEAHADYIESVFLTDRAIEGIDEFRRALVLFWVYAKRDDALWERFWDLAVKQVQHACDNGWPGAAFPLCDEALDRNREACERMAPIIQAHADKIAASAPYEAARYYDYAARLWHRLRQTDTARAAQTAQGEALVAAAAQAADSNPLVAPDWLMEGIAVLRRARATPSRISELRDLLNRYQLNSLDHFHGNEFKLDVSDWIHFIDREVVGPTFFEALLQMAFRVEKWLDFDAIRAETLKSAEEFVLSSLIQTHHSNNEGAVVARQEALDRNDESTIFQRMVRQAREVYLDMRGKVLVRHVTSMLYSNYQPPFFAIKEIVDASPFTPKDHSETMARGFYAGMCDDWVAAAAYLIPSVEPLVRSHLRRRGAHTTVHREDGTQQERTLSELLAMSEAEQVFGKGLVFELQTLLTEPLGYNLRHQYCHGLMPDQQLQNSGTMALWWCLWRIILFPWRDHPSLQVMSHSSEDEDTGIAAEMPAVASQHFDPEAN